VRILAIINGAVNGNGPHGGGITIAVAIILLTAIARCPDIDVAQTIATLRVARKYEINEPEDSDFSSAKVKALSYLIDTLDNGTHGRIARPIDRLAIIGGTPRGAVYMDFVRLMPH